MSEFRNVYSKITNRIIADLEQGVRPWMRPWSAEHAAGRITRPLRSNGIPYKGINVVMLWSASVMKGYSCPLWLTFKQALELGGNVKKGEHGELVVYANRITRTETNEAGEETEREIPVLKGYTVFNAEQCDGLSAHYSAKAEPPTLPPAARIERADQFFVATGADIRVGGTRAYYAEGPDYVQVPPFETFRDAESHAATLAHELTHWTKHNKRLARDMGRIRWGDEGYAKASVPISKHARGSRGPRRLYRPLAEGLAGRQAADLCRCRPCTAGRGLPAFAAIETDRRRAGRRIGGPARGDSNHVPAPLC
jgi:antirestriction protein ArdC